MTYTLITGACGVLGGAFVQLLAQKGEPLFLTGRSEARLTALCERLKGQYPRLALSYCACDLTNSQDRAALFARADEAGIRFSRLVYVAGIDTQKAFEKYTEEKLVMQARVNFEGAVSLASGFLARCSHNGKSELLVIGSVSGIYPMPYFALYSASKKALEQFFGALHTELKGRVKVTCVLPGAIPTREDVKESIKTQGLWGKIAPLSSETVARRALKAVKRNKRKCILGGWNKLMRAFTAPLPTSWKLRLIARRWKKTEKDAFS